jgi:hypothetical protein
LGWKKKFGLPMEMAKEAIGIKNYRTYAKTFYDLIEWGFIELIQKSKNQYSSNIIAIVENAKANTEANTIAPTKALDKALQKHSQKQGQSIVGINKQETRNNEQETITQENDPTIEILENYPFEEFWELYDKKKGNQGALRFKWQHIDELDKIKIFDHVKKYKASQPDKVFRKDPLNYLNDESWKDEVIFKSQNNGHGKQSVNNLSVEERIKQARIRVYGKAGSSGDPTG